LYFEQTVAQPVAISGVGLHHGVPVNIKIRPAPAGTGIVFLRTDLRNFSLPASWQHVARVSYATSLMRQGVLISTTEHLLSVLYSSGIDNCWIDIDNLEVPILDGSGKPFVELLREAGVVQPRAVASHAEGSDSQRRTGRLPGEAQTRPHLVEHRYGRILATQSLYSNPFKGLRLAAVWRETRLPLALAALAATAALAGRHV